MLMKLISQMEKHEVIMCLITNKIADLQSFRWHCLSTELHHCDLAIHNAEKTHYLVIISRK